MSLLLKALQNAARNREAAGNARIEPGSDAGEPRERPTELTLEPVEPSPRASARSHSPLNAERTEGQPPPGPQQAQTVLRASARAELPRRREPGFVDWLAQRPLVAFSTAAGLFAIGYGIYLYLQITNPALFIARPSAPAPGPSQVASATPPQTPAPRPPASAVARAPSTSPGATRTPATAGTPGSDAPASGSPLSAPQSTPGSAAAVPGAGSAASSLPSSGAGAASAPRASAGPQSPAAAAGSSASSSSSRAATGSERPAPERAPAARRDAAAAAAAGSIVDAPRAAGSARTDRETLAVAPEAGIAAPGTDRPATASRRPATPSPSVGALPAEEGVAQAGGPQLITVNNDVARGYEALGQGRLEEAEQLYRSAVASDGRNVDALLGLASVLAQQAQGDAASRLYMRVLELDPRNTYAQAGLLNLAGRADPRAAEARLKQLIARDPSAFLYFTLGNLYSEQGQWAAAQSAYFQAHQLAPDNPDYAFNLAVGLEHLSQPKIALDYYRRAVSLAHARGHAQFELARVENRIRSLEAVLTR